MIWRCAGDFFKVLLKFKIAATDQLNFFVGAQKLKKLVWSFFSNFNIAFLATWGCASDFLSCYQKSKWLSNFTFPTIWKCAGDFFEVLIKFKMAAMDKLHNFFWAKKLMAVIIHILQSPYSPSGNVQVILLKFKIATTSQLLNICDRKKI